MKRPLLSSHVLLCLLCLLGLTAGCKRPIEREAEKQVRAVLPEYIGHADKYAVKVQGDSTGALMRGRLRQVHIEGQKVQIEPTLLLDRLTVDFDEVSVDTKARRLENIGRATFDCRVHTSVLNSYVKRLQPDIADLNIALRADSIFITARPDALGLVEKPLGISLPGKLGVPITVEGKLQAVNGTRLDFAPEKAAVSVIPVPQVALDFLARKVNPVVNLSNLRIPIQADRAYVRGEYLYFSGSIRPDDLLKMQK